MEACILKARYVLILLIITTLITIGVSYMTFHEEPKEAAHDEPSVEVIGYQIKTYLKVVIDEEYEGVFQLIKDGKGLTFTCDGSVALSHRYYPGKNVLICELQGAPEDYDDVKVVLL